MLVLVRSGFSLRWLLRQSFGLILAGCLVFSHLSFAQATGSVQCAKLMGVPLEATQSHGPHELTVMTYNFANAFFKEAAIKRGDYEILKKRNVKFKDADDLARQRQILKEVNPDIVVATEVHKIEDARLILEGDPDLRDRYHVFLKEGNDQRGINIAFFVKKSLGLRYKLQSHKDLQWKDPVTNDVQPLFSRDLPVLSLFKNGENIPFLKIIGNHAKSKRDSEKDPESSRYRTAQYQGAGKIIESLKRKNQEQYGKEVPIVFAGDFNTDTVKSPEIEPIRQHLKSVFDSVKGRVYSYQDRVTHFYFGPDGRRGTPLDGIFVSSGLEVQDAYVYQYKDAQGQMLPDPRSFKQRETQPGDHEPVVTNLKVL